MAVSAEKIYRILARVDSLRGTDRCVQIPGTCSREFSHTDHFLEFVVAGRQATIHIAWIHLARRLALLLMYFTAITYTQRIEPNAI